MQTKTMNRRRLFFTALAGLFMSSLGPIHADDLALTQDLDQLKKDYTGQCLETNIIERIQLTRMTDRRRQKAIECSAEMWTEKALDLVDHHYKNKKEIDKEFRSRTADLIDLQLPWKNKNNNSFLSKLEFAIKTSTPASETESSNVKVDTLKRYTTLNQ